MMTLGQRMAIYERDLDALSPAAVKRIAMAGLVYGYQINLLETAPNAQTIRNMSQTAGDIFRTYRCEIEAEQVGDFAQAIETRSATTAGRGPKDESAVPEGDAP